MSPHQRPIPGCPSLPAHREHSRGFSLVEISIVMAIIGLIVGGIIAGQSLFRAAELRSVMKDMTTYLNSYNMFLEKYRYRPGDLPTAIDYWGAANADPNTCRTTIGVGTQTCNGNGNGQIAYNTNEEFRAWQHLANAGLINGQFTGVGVGVGNYEAVPDTNVPGSKMTSAGFSMYYLAPVTVTTWATWEYTGTYGHLIAFGKYWGGNKTKEKILRPQEALLVDTKLDDGLPGIGTVRAMKGTGGGQPNCTTATDRYASRYSPTHKDIACMLYFIFED